MAYKSKGNKGSRKSKTSSRVSNSSSLNEMCLRCQKPLTGILGWGMSQGSPVIPLVHSISKHQPPSSSTLTQTRLREPICSLHSCTAIQSPVLEPGPATSALCSPAFCAMIVSTALFPVLFLLWEQKCLLSEPSLLRELTDKSSLILDGWSTGGREHQRESWHPKRASQIGCKGSILPSTDWEKWIGTCKLVLAQG